MNRRRRGAFTLLEIMIAAVVAGLLLHALFQLLVGGLRMAVIGTAAARGPEQAILLFDRVERDLVQALQIPGDPRPPARVLDGGRALEFFVPDLEETGLEVVTGTPVRWGLVPASGPGAAFHPARGDQALRAVRVRELEFRLLEPDEEALRRGWFVAVTATFPAENRLARDYTLTRLMRLPQPSTNHQWFPLAGADLLPGLVRLEGGGGIGAPGPGGAS